MSVLSRLPRIPDRRLGAAGLVLLLAATAPGQGSLGYPLWQATGSASSGLGTSVAAVGDVNGDGVPDLLAGAPFAAQGALQSAGEARLLSGASGATLLVLAGAAAFEMTGTSVAGPGDLSGDGVPDLLVGSPRTTVVPDLPQPTGLVRAYSGATGAILFSPTGTTNGDRFGQSLAAFPDANGDGVPDFLAGAHQPPSGGFTPAGPGYVRLCSGSTGATLLTVSGTAVGDGFGYAVAAAGDVNGDGAPDALAGAPGPLTSFGPGSYARVVSGGNGATILTIPAQAPSTRLGFTVAGLGDVSGDGTPDLLAGDLFTARVFSGSTGAVLSSSSGTGLFTEGYAYAVDGAGDANGDGASDFLVGAPQHPISGFGWDTGYAEVRSGRSGALLFTLEGTALGSCSGAALAAAGDLDGDGLPDWAIGAPGKTLYGATNSPAGAVRAVSAVGMPPGTILLGTGCPGSGGFVPRIATSGGYPLPGNGDFEIVLSRALGGGTALLVIGLSSQSWGGAPLPLSLAPFGLPACSLFVSGDAVVPVPVPGAGPGNGVVFFPLPVPLDPNLVALFVHFQWYVLDPGPAPLPGALSAGLRVLIL